MALTSAMLTGKKVTGHTTVLPRPGLCVPKQPSHLHTSILASAEMEGTSYDGSGCLTTAESVHLKTIPCRLGPQGCARAGWEMRAHKGMVAHHPDQGSRQLRADSSCSCWPRDWNEAPCTPLQVLWCPHAPGGSGDWRGVLAEEGGMVWRIKLEDTTQTSR